MKNYGIYFNEDSILIEEGVIWDMSKAKGKETKLSHISLKKDFIAVCFFYQRFLVIETKSGSSLATEIDETLSELEKQDIVNFII